MVKTGQGNAPVTRIRAAAKANFNKINALEIELCNFISLVQQSSPREALPLMAGRDSGRRSSSPGGDCLSAALFAKICSLSLAVVAKFAARAG